MRPEPDEHRQDRRRPDDDERGQLRPAARGGDASRGPRRPVALHQGAADRRDGLPGEGAPDFCYVRALVDGVPMDPNGAGFEAMDSEDGTASAHAYEWVKRVGEGPHTVRIEQRVGNGATTFWVDEMTFDIVAVPLESTPWAGLR